MNKKLVKLLVAAAVPWGLIIGASGARANAAPTGTVYRVCDVCVKVLLVLWMAALFGFLVWVSHTKRRDNRYFADMMANGTYADGIDYFKRRAASYPLTGQIVNAKYNLLLTYFLSGDHENAKALLYSTRWGVLEGNVCYYFILCAMLDGDMETARTQFERLKRTHQQNRIENCKRLFAHIDGVGEIETMESQFPIVSQIVDAYRRTPKKTVESIPDTPDEPAAEEPFLCPQELELELEKADLAARDVLVGSLGSELQLRENLEKNFYFVPAKYYDANKNPVRYVAVYQSKRFLHTGIRYFGEVTDVSLVKRRDVSVPLRRDNGDEDYWLFKIAEWDMLTMPIEALDSGIAEPRLTNLFLLKHCMHTYELFEVHSIEQFRLLYALKQIRIGATVNVNAADKTVRRCPLGGGHTLLIEGGCLDVENSHGTRMLTVPVPASELARHPDEVYRTLAKHLMKKET